jgi:two-component system, NarL family, sensor kinase
MNDQTIFAGIVVTTLVILLLIAGIVISVFIANRQRLQQEIKLSQLELDYANELRNAELEVKEQLKSHISRELHDHVGHTLTYMRLMIENKKLDDENLVATFSPIEELLEQASTQLRLLSRSMNTDYLSGLTFQDAIQQETDRLIRFTRMQVDYRPGTTKYSGLDKDQMLMSFRIFQEILNNAIKHSGANQLSIRSNHSEFLLQVSDDGKGFDFDEIFKAGKASGLANLKKRAQLAKLNLLIESIPLEGTTYTLMIPNSVEPS